MNVRKAQKADIDSIEKIYDRIHDSEEQGLSTIGWIRGVLFFFFQYKNVLF